MAPVQLIATALQLFPYLYYALFRTFTVRQNANIVKNHVSIYFMLIGGIWVILCLILFYFSQRLLVRNVIGIRHAQNREAKSSLF